MTAIIVPLFNAVSESHRCLDALARTVGERRPVIVIDDASTEPAVAAMMGALPPRWVRVRNERNLGFGATANFGLSLASSEDVVLLNSDTEVTSGWLEAIEACAAADPGIASITPLSNNAEIASIPGFCQANPWPECPEEWARACRESGPPQYPEVPTAVGFCMYMRRRCLDQIGAFDELVFGMGYGEENDWCMRALAAGWRHVLCDQAFVAHQGNASFGPVGLAPGGAAMDRLLARHPDYLERVQAFIQADPMAARREAILRFHARMGIE
ncbi:MAG: glycosyltransferase [Wenzhouxiangella sp.]|nr:glycosyltransferase [Wenzhouxiangella sp.]